MEQPNPPSGGWGITRLAGAAQQLQTGVKNRVQGMVDKGARLVRFGKLFGRPSAKLTAKQREEFEAALMECLVSTSPTLQQLHQGNPSQILAICCKFFESSRGAPVSSILQALVGTSAQLLQLVHARESCLSQLQQNMSQVLEKHRVSTHTWTNSEVENMLSREDTVKGYCLLRIALEQISLGLKLHKIQPISQGSDLKSLQDAEANVIQCEQIILIPPDEFWKTQLGLTYQEYDSLNLPMKKVRTAMRESRNDLLERLCRVHGFGKQAVIAQELVEEKQGSVADDLLSLWCVLSHCFLATFNFYGYYAAFSSIPQTNPNLASYISNAGYFQIIFAIGPVVEMVLQKYYEYLSKKNYSIIYAHSVLFLIVGNLCYFFQSKLSDSGNLALLMVSRAFIGAGVAKKASEKYLSVMINSKYRGLVNLLCSLSTRSGQMLGPSIAVWFVLNRNGQTIDYFPVLMSGGVGLLGLSMLLFFKPQSDKISMRQKRDEIEAANLKQELMEMAEEENSHSTNPKGKSKNPQNAANRQQGRSEGYDNLLTGDEADDQKGQYFQQKMNEGWEEFKKQTEIYLRWSTWYLFALSVCSKLAMEMFFTEKSMISNSWTAAGYTLSASGFIYLILTVVNTSATFTFNKLMKCCPPRFFLPFGIFTLLIASMIKFPYDVAKSMGLILYYMGTVGIIF